MFCMVKGNRFAYISWLRVVAMILVVMSHSLDYYTPFWHYPDSAQVNTYFVTAKILNNIHMPIFVFVSGFLYHYQLEKKAYANNLNFIKGKIKRLLIPFLVWSAIIVAFISNRNYIEFIIYGASHLWFLGMLLILFLIFHPTQKIWTNFTVQKDSIAFTGMLFVSIIILRIPSNPGVIIHQVFAYMYVFYAGMMTHKYDKYVNLHHFKKYLMGGVIGLLIIILLCASDIKGGQYLMKPLKLWTIMNIFIYAKSQQWSDNIILRTFDTCSMGIYLIHHVLIEYFLTFSDMREFMNSHLWMPFVLFPVLIVSSFTITLIIKRIPYLKVIIG